jgi:hypothetical protein
MKLAVIKLGARLSFNANDSSGGRGEACSIIEMLHAGGNEMHLYTEIRPRDKLIEPYIWHDIVTEDIHSVDALVVINGIANFFGGQERLFELRNYQEMNKFKGPIIYIYCDPNLPFKDVNVRLKPWKDKWPGVQLDRKDVICITQSNDLEAVMKRITPTREVLTKTIIPQKIVHFPFEKFPCLRSTVPFNEHPEVDLSYGGTMRNGRREKSMMKFYFGHPDDISVEMFGNISEDAFPATDLRKPLFTKPVLYQEMMLKMNKALAHCVIGDPHYSTVDILPQRAYESIWANCVTFIDATQDRNSRIFAKDKELSEFLLVETREDLTERIQLLKKDTKMRRDITEAQFAAVDFDGTKYCNDLSTLISDLIKGY